MQKTDFKVTPSQKQSLMTAELIEKLKTDPEVNRLFQESLIPAEQLHKKPWMIEQYLEDTAVCRNCRGLSACTQKEKGYRPELKYDSVHLKSIYCACPYMKKQLQAHKHMQNYLVSDLSAEMETVSFEDIRIQTEDASYIAVLKQAMQAVKDNKGLYLYGTMGTGKTYISACAANFYARNGRKTAFIHYPTFCQRIRANAETKEYMTEVQRLTYADFLVIDDVGAENVTAWNRDDILLPILNERMEHKLITWMTSNEDLESLLNHFSVTSRGQQEKLKAMRIMERIQAMCLPLKLLGRDRRTLK